MSSPRSRAVGALYGLAIGDALGMPTQLLPRAKIVAEYGPVVDHFRPGPLDHPIAAGLPAGSITDDTEQALLLAQVLIDGRGQVDAAELGRRLVVWEQDMKDRGSLDLLGPSTRAALDALQAGADPSESGRRGTTNGAAMRIAPVGIASPAGDPERLVDRVVEASALTHNTGVALAGAAAVAAAISAGVDGASMTDALTVALEAAARAEPRGSWTAGASLPARLRWATELVAGLGPAEAIDIVGELVGTSVAAIESVPAAFALWVAAAGDPWLTACLGASVGGDCDTIAAIGAAMAGAGAGVDAFPPEARALVSHVNRLDLEQVADGLLALRDAARTTAAPAPAAGRRPTLHQTGNAVVDLVLAVPRLPVRAGDVVSSGAELLAGGGTNLMVAAARRGVAVRYAGAHGSGPMGDLVRATLRAEGIEIVTTGRANLDTGVVATLVEPDGERTFVTAPGAEVTVEAEDLAATVPAPGDGVAVSGYGLVAPGQRAALVRFVAALDPAVLVVFDPGPLVAELDPAALEAILARADWVTANQHEAGLLTSADAAEEAARRLASRARQGAVVRVGARGAWVGRRAGSPQLVPGVAATVVDTNGAGDTHTGVLVAELLGGADVVDAVRTANAAAAWSVGRHGPATAPSPDELAAFLAAPPMTSS